jgi:hypothetical protein
LPGEQDTSGRGGSSGNHAMRPSHLTVNPTPSTREAVLSNDDAASLLLSLSPKATPHSLSPAPGSHLQGHAMSRGPSFELTPGGSLRGVNMGRCPSLLSEHGAGASSSPLGARPGPWDASHRASLPAPAQGGPRGEAVSRSLSTLEALPLSREASGIPLSACLSLLREEELGRSDTAGGSAPPFAGASLAGVPFSRDLSKISVSGFLNEDEPSPEGDKAGDKLGLDKAGGGMALKGVPMVKDISGISMSGCLNMLE